MEEDRLRYLELLDGKLLLVTNTDAPAEQVVQRYKSLADIERGFRVLKSDKTHIVYCQDINRRADHSVVQFTFLGYTFRPRKVVDKYGRVTRARQALAKLGHANKNAFVHWALGCLGRPASRHIWRPCSCMLCQKTPSARRVSGQPA